MKKFISLLIVASLVAAMSLLCGCPNPDESTTTTIMQVKGKTFKLSTVKITFSKDTKDRIKAGTLKDDEKNDISLLAGWSQWDESVTAENIDQKVAESMKIMYGTKNMEFTDDGCKYMDETYSYTQKGNVITVKIETDRSLIINVNGDKLIWEQKENFGGEAPTKMTFVKA